MISRRERFLQIIEVLTKHGFGFALGGLKPQWRAPLARVKLIDPQTVHSQPEHPVSYTHLTLPTIYSV